MAPIGYPPKSDIIKIQKQLPLIPKRNREKAVILDSIMLNKPVLYRNKTQTPNGKREGITILLHITRPFIAPLTLLSGEISSISINKTVNTITIILLIFILSPFKYMNTRINNKPHSYF